MIDDTGWVSREDRVALAARDGIFVHSVRRQRGSLRVFVTGPHEALTRDRVAMQLGHEYDIRYCGDVPRAVRPVQCYAYAEADPGCLDLRFMLRFEQQVADVLVVEDDDTVVVLGYVCMSVLGDAGDPAERCVPAYLSQPLGSRLVIDAFSREPVPALLSGV
jgi:hypothetical protein